MEKYIIVKEWNGNISAFNISMFSTYKEAKKTMGWYYAKMAAEFQANQKYWGNNDKLSDIQPNLSIAKVII